MKSPHGLHGRSARLGQGPTLNTPHTSAQSLSLCRGDPAPHRSPVLSSLQRACTCTTTLPDSPPHGRAVYPLARPPTERSIKHARPGRGASKEGTYMHYMHTGPDLVQSDSQKQSDSSDASLPASARFGARRA